MKSIFKKAFKSLSWFEGIRAGRDAHAQALGYNADRIFASLQEMQSKTIKA